MSNSNTNIIPAIENPELLVVENLRGIIAESKRLAVEAALKEERRIGGDNGSVCGFAWVEIYGIKGNTRLGRMLKKIGVKQEYIRAFHIWNPSGLPVQSLSIKEAGADACAEYLKSKGFKACSCSRLD